MTIALTLKIIRSRAILPIRASLMATISMKPGTAAASKTTIGVDGHELMKICRRASIALLRFLIHKIVQGAYQQNATWIALATAHSERSGSRANAAR